MIKYHLNNLLNTKPYKVALLEIRTHAAYYLKGLPQSKELKTEIFKCTKKEELFKLLDDYMEELNEMEKN